MDKSVIKNFAIEARNMLMKSAVTEAGFYGVTKDECKSPVQKGEDYELYETVAGTENRIYGGDIKRRANLVRAIRNQGFDQVIEETAYTWFNRIIAIRFMEVNNYLPTRVRVLSSETGSGTPDIINQADTVELNMTSEELAIIQNAKRENRYDDAFRQLFIKQCNQLNDILPGLFEKTDDYMELLLKISYTGDGVVRMLVDTIPEEYFNVENEGQIEIIGWMYQYYNTELKDDTFAKLKKNVKISKEKIPAATQLFTPDWIVRYMVENSLGRVWIEHLRAEDSSVDECAKATEFGWKYYLPEAEQKETVTAQLIEIRRSYKDLTPQDITCIDPCMGSGHILVYMFDVLMDIYRSEGFSEREAVFDILEKNISGLDIDRRAYQLSYFALMMKARGYNRIFFRGREDNSGNRVKVWPKVYAIEESNTIDKEQLSYYGVGLDDIQKNNAINQMTGLLDTLRDAKEYGSVLNVDNYDWDLLRKFVDMVDESGQISFTSFAAYNSQELLKRLIDIGEALSKKYKAVVTNPPYMAISSGSPKLVDFINKNYIGGKTDLFAAFIERCITFLSANSFLSMITMQSWMFLTSFERLRKVILSYEIQNMMHLGARGFDEISGEVVQTVAFTLRKSNCKGQMNGCYVRLVDGEDENAKKNSFLNRENYYTNRGSNFERIPQNLIAYWVGDSVINCFENENLSQIFTTREGMATADNDRFLRLWYEVLSDRITYDCENNMDSIRRKVKWVPYNKGGTSRKWYGNNDYVVDWANDGFEIKNNKDPKTGRIRSHNYNGDYGFLEGATWSAISSGDLCVRYTPKGFLFDSKGAKGFANNSEDLKWVLALLNGKVSMQFLQFISPTLDFKVGDIISIPYIYSDEYKTKVEELSDNAVYLCKNDWDSFETSWDFKCHPFIEEIKKHKERFSNPDNIFIEECFRCWEAECEERFTRLKTDEEELNRIFISIYGLNNELTPEVEDKDIAVRRADLSRDIRSLLSYAVGCMFGRYSIDESGLICAGGVLDSNRYGSFRVDRDAIIPITDEQYFDDSWSL